MMKGVKLCVLMPARKTHEPQMCSSMFEPVTSRCNVNGVGGKSAAPSDPHHSQVPSVDMPG